MCHCHQKSCCCSKDGCGCQSSQCGCQKSSGCGCQGGGCGCQAQKSCGCGCKSCGCDYASKFLELADCAWKELLKEKIKEHIQSSSKNMDELARIIAEANRERWQKKMDAGKCSGSFEKQLCEFFGQSCETKGQKGK